MQTILLATGSKIINDAIRTLNYKVVGEIYERSDLRKFALNLNPNIVIISENLKGKNQILIEEMLYIKSCNPNIRIIYLAGFIDIKNKDKLNKLSNLVFAGIYDIYGEKKITLTVLKELLSNVKTKDDVAYLTRYIRKENLTQDSFVEMDALEEKAEDVEDNGYKNVILISSIKPGSGKSFVASNIAAGLAKFGKKKDGTPLKVVVIDADLQNLSIGTLLDCEDEKYNLGSAANKIQTILNSDGDLIGNSEQMLEVNEFVKKCCLPSKNIKNLYAIAGSQLPLKEVEKITPYIYVYMIEILSKEYDYVIVDSNSSLFHATTYPVLKLSNKIYYILNLDYNNVRNNQRYKKDLRSLEVDKKIKYILNEDIEAMENTSNENLIFGSEYLERNLRLNLIAKIPVIEKPIFLNRVFKAVPLILDQNDYTLKARKELLRIVNDIVPIDEYDRIEKEVAKKFGTKRR
ncbi:AAA family ATPase [Clostridium sp.]|uniref:AAA family ATPase n=1 Tax=Clostridium sp. TaxID=1506 RepID=UPI001B6EFAE3|nr:AAA family ATPase [Clostridium sp.]MBP3916173.1 AAA family ATPase [Clostridium sp.]